MIVKKGIENADCKIKSEDELMNKSDFNLIEEQWIPVAQIGLVSLRDIFSNPDLPAFRWKCAGENCGNEVASGNCASLIYTS